ncbi:AAA family ATPase [Salmonella enterica subsp. enterica]|nr:AAA family ATPase [Salmonella enterica subsp. enterica serovar Wagenia]
MGKITLVEQALQFHKDYYGKENFGTVVKDHDYYPKVAEIFINRKNRKIYSNLDIEPIASSIVHTGSNPVMAKNGRIKKLMFRDGSGAYRIHLGQNEVVHIIRFILNAKVRMEYAVGTTKSMSMLHSLCEAGRAKLNRTLPRKGIWRTDYFEGIYYHGRARKEEIDNSLRFSVHPKYAELESDFNQFFADIDYYTRYGQAGMRKVLFTGPPGTGKTTIAKALAARYQDKYVFVYADQNFKEICYAAAKKKIPVIIIAEETDELYRADAKMLGFLDGADTPRNVAGTYIIFSTNYPKRIDPRIRKRPGRIDRIISVGAFRTKAAAACAKMYLPDDVSLNEKELGCALDRTTPAEIKEIINIAIGMIRGTKHELSVETIQNARNFLKGSLTLSAIEADEDMDSREDDFKRNGAQPDYDSYLDE